MRKLAYAAAAEQREFEKRSFTAYRKAMPLTCRLGIMWACMHIRNISDRYRQTIISAFSLIFVFLFVPYKSFCDRLAYYILQ